MTYRCAGVAPDTFDLTMSCTLSQLEALQSVFACGPDLVGFARERAEADGRYMNAAIAGSAMHRLSVEVAKVLKKAKGP